MIILTSAQVDPVVMFLAPGERAPCECPGDFPKDRSILLAVRLSKGGKFFLQSAREAPSITEINTILSHKRVRFSDRLVREAWKHKDADNAIRKSYGHPSVTTDVFSVFCHNGAVIPIVKGKETVLGSKTGMRLVVSNVWVKQQLEKRKVKSSDARTTGQNLE